MSLLVCAGGRYDELGTSAVPVPQRTPELTAVDLPPELLALLKQPSTCYIATTMPDGSPQLTQVWCDTDGEHILVNTVEGHQKVPTSNATSGSRSRCPTRPTRAATTPCGVGSSTSPATAASSRRGVSERSSAAPTRGTEDATRSGSW